MPQPNPIAFTIFGTDIMWYAICVTLGIVTAAIIVYWRAPKHGMTGDQMLTYIVICVPVGIIGARAYYVLFNWSWYAGDIVRILNIREGGLAIHGGLILGLCCGAFLCRLRRNRPLDLLDLCMPAIALAQSIGRWGNYFNSEAHGGPTDLPWGVFIDGQTYHPTFLYESIWCLILFFVLLYVDNHRKFEGQVLLLYGILYSCERILVEALRTDSLMIGSLKQAQVFSITVVVVCTIFYVILNKKSKK
ncbi:MAG: prolipoprotein diacylglyceryl transferase [Bacillota bacterium]|nr:prolipoprotein diacylglyceryl transferase [Bacillota bacterium]